MKKIEKGQGLIEYALIIILAAVVVCAVIALFAFLLIPFVWPWFVGIVAGVLAGDPVSVAILIAIVLVVMVIAFRRRR